MNTNSINVLGYTGSNSQLIVKTPGASLRITQDTIPERQNPYEYILAGLAGCINALGWLVAAEQGLALKSLQVEITAGFTMPGQAEPAGQGFQTIEITLKPATSAPLVSLQKWLREVQLRSPVHDNLVNNTPVDVLLYKGYSYN